MDINWLSNDPSLFKSAGATTADTPKSMAELAALLREMDSIVCHPRAARRLREVTPVFEEPDLFKQPIGIMSFSYLNAIPLQETTSVPEKRKTGRVLFPKDPFVEYEDADRQWALPLGIATEETETVYYVVKRPQWSTLLSSVYA